MFTPTMSSSEMPSSSLTNARRELPCATIRTLSPFSILGLISWSKYGTTLATVSFRLSVRGISALSSFL